MTEKGVRYMDKQSQFEGGGTRRHARDRLILVLALTLIISVMNATMFNIVLPKMSEELGLSFAEVSFVFSAYILVYAIGSAIYGKLADRFQLKNLITFGLSFLVIGSAVGMAAPGFGFILLGRILQAAGAAVIPAAAMIIPVRFFPAEIRGRAFGTTAAGLALGNALGPVVSALIAGTVHWRWLFGVPALLLVTIPFYRKLLGAEEVGRGRFDALGGGLLAGAVTLLLLSVTFASWSAAGGCLLLFALFILRIQRAEQPFVQPRLFRNRTYRTGLAINVLIMGIGYSLPLLTPKLLADASGLEPGWIGLAMVPAAAISALLGRKAGKLADARGNRFLYTIASLLLVTGFALMSAFAGASPAFIAVFLIFGTVGQMFIQISMQGTISRSLPKDQTGVGMGLVAMLNFLTGAVVTSVYSRMIDLDAGMSWNPLNTDPGTAAYGNLYLALALLHIGLLAYYRFRFSKSPRNIGAAAGESRT